MTTTTPVTVTLEPWKRTLRTVIAIVVATATVVPWIVALVTKEIDPSTGLTVILTQLTAVAAAVTRFAASPAGNYVFGLIGLDAAKVTKLATDTEATITIVTPAVDAAVTAVKNPSSTTITDAANAALAVEPAAVKAAKSVKADAKAATK